MSEVSFIMLYIQFSVVIGCLLVGSVLDLIKREVSDIPWIIMALVGFVTTIVFVIYTENRRGDGILIGVNFVIGVAIGFLLFYTGVMGGADAKAIMALSLNTAVYPFPFELVSLDVYDFIPSIFNIFFNWLLVMVIIYPLPLLAYNIFKRARGNLLFDETNANFASKILMLISGYQLPVEKAKERVDIVYSEVYDEEEQQWDIKHFIQVSELEEEERYKKEIEDKIKKTKREKIWIKVLPPGIVFLLIGYVINIFIGNIFFMIYHFAF
ncbi:MAG: prepilin peptidase [Candidatus Heimdallarchaeota archaeon]|nr:prepilin peptidase [Candidatus Heimdallarchaeota archaeon]MCK4953953.1 prepilin peptidase [Candidatus Heimdallarchaeota archaeon]